MPSLNINEPHHKVINVIQNVLKTYLSNHTKQESGKRDSNP